MKRKFDFQLVNYREKTADIIILCMLEEMDSEGWEFISVVNSCGSNTYYFRRPYTKPKRVKKCK
jgi:hypothetical protein